MKLRLTSRCIAAPSEAPPALNPALAHCDTRVLLLLLHYHGYDRILLLLCPFRVGLMNVADGHYNNIYIICTGGERGRRCFFSSFSLYTSLVPRAPCRRAAARKPWKYYNRWTFFVWDAIIFGLPSCAPEFENRLPTTGIRAAAAAVELASAIVKTIRWRIYHYNIITTKQYYKHFSTWKYWGPRSIG